MPMHEQSPNPKIAAASTAANSPAKQVIVVGGGLAGCTTALALARSGVQVTLIEAKNRLGGRAGSYVDRTSGQTVDYCQHVGMNCCTNLQQLIQWLGQADDWERCDRLYFYGPDGRRQCLKALPWLPAPLHLASWLWSWPGLSWIDRLAIARGMQAIDRLQLPRWEDSDGADDENQQHLDELSAQQWLREQAQPQRAIERFWNTIIVSALGEEIDRVSLAAVAKVFQDGFLRHRDAFHLLIPRLPLNVLFGERMVSALQDAKVRILLGQSVNRLRWNADRCASVDLDNGQSIACDFLVMATPWHAVPELIHDTPLESLNKAASGAAQLKPSPITGVHTWWDKAWLPTPHAVIVGRLCQWVFPHVDAFTEKDAQATPAQSPTGTPAQTLQTTEVDNRDRQTQASDGSTYYQVVISASRSLPRGDSDAMRRLIAADLQLVFPSSRKAKLLRIRTVTDPQAVYSIEPGMGQSRVPAGRVFGNLTFAGDWVQTGWPATMEGAILSGMRAAEAFWSLMGSPKSFTAPLLSPNSQKVSINNGQVQPHRS